MNDIPTKAVKAIIIKNDLLLLLKSKNGIWDLPGGLMEKRESQKEALLRECFEEISQDIIFLQKGKEWSFIRIFDKKTVKVQNYFCDITSDNIILSPEHVEYKWVGLSEIEKLKIKDASFMQALK